MIQGGYKMNDDIMTKVEAAKYMKVSISTINRLMSETDIPYSKLGAKVLFLKKDLLEWIEDRRVKK
jgi:excisionase family DNA binding protein